MNKDSIVLTKTTVVPFTEYVLPNGRKRPHPIGIEDEHQDEYHHEGDASQECYVTTSYVF